MRPGAYALTRSYEDPPPPRLAFGSPGSSRAGRSKSGGAGQATGDDGLAWPVGGVGARSGPASTAANELPPPQQLPPPWPPFAGDDPMLEESLTSLSTLIQAGHENLIQAQSQQFTSRSQLELASSSSLVTQMLRAQAAHDEASRARIAIFSPRRRGILGWSAALTCALIALACAGALVWVEMRFQNVVLSLTPSPPSPPPMRPPPPSSPFPSPPPPPKVGRAP